MKIKDFIEKDLGMTGKELESGWFRTRCPFHEDNRPSFGVNLSAPYNSHCFVCGGFSLINLVARVKKLSVSEAINYIRFRKIVTSITRKITEHVTDTVAIKALSETFMGNLRLKSAAVARKYLHSRGIPPFLLRAAGVGYDDYDKQVMIPIRSVQSPGDFIGFDSRGFYAGDDEGVEKRLYLAEGSKKKAMLAFPQNFRRLPGIIVSEGFFDMARIFMWLVDSGRTGDYGVVGFCGAGCSDEQFRFLARFDKVVLAGDRDLAGERFEMKIKERLGFSIPVSYLDYAAEDPGEAPLESFRFCFRRC